MPCRCQVVSTRSVATFSRSNSSMSKRSRRLLSLVGAAAIAFAAIGAVVAGPASLATGTAVGREADGGVEFGEAMGRIEALKPRGATGEDQPAWARRIAAVVSRLVPQNGVQYHGGPVVMGEKVVAIYWASSAIFTGGPNPATTPTGPGSADGSLVGHFLRNVGGSPYYNINTRYGRRRDTNPQQPLVHQLLGRQ